MDGDEPATRASSAYRCIECDEIELARVREVGSSQTLPIPSAALDGFPAGRSARELTRRRLLQFGLAGFASIYAPRYLGWDSVWDSVAAAAGPAPGNTLVVIYLAGGNDALNTVVPVDGAQYSAYASARPALHRIQGPSGGGRIGSMPFTGPAGSALAWPNVVVSRQGGGDNGSPQYGLDQLYGAGNLAVMPAVDYTPPNLSHFTSSDYWFSGAEQQLSTGWLGRWIDRNGSATNPFQAVSIDQAISKDIRSRVNPVSAIPSLAALGFRMYGSPGGAPQSFDANSQMRKLAATRAGPSNAYLARTRATYGVAVQAYDSGRSLTLSPPPPGVNYPANLNDQNSLSYKLRMAALLVGANVGTRIVTIHWGGFDTHGEQLTRQDPQLTELSLALGAFQGELQARGIDQRVATLMFSEFGRRVHENGSAGTDHGAGGLMMLGGTPVRGGLAAPFPGCRPRDLDRTGNLQVATDFRSVYGSILTEWLGDDPAAILPGTPAGGWPALQRQDGGSNLFK